ncbi:MAG: cyclic nucleotide-binding domain-containing protein [Motiliproteus sp.]|nr:cyclic nucleotide-binding domain-containing protein [Motiliproteus sp.]MCW9052931.1 cyclic nucleotide-binding domain-containing protein [Motiliproteus sp.]
MKEIPLSEMPLRNLVNILQKIPFYRDVYERDSTQLQLLLKHSKIIYLDPGEVIIHKGEIDFWIYSVVKGLLKVSPDQSTAPDHIIDHIPPGEMFGELAVVLEAPRNATVVGDENSKQTILFGSDFSPFGELEDFTRVGLHTKLIFYRRALRVTQKRLTCYHIDYPDFLLQEPTEEIEPFSGKQDSTEQLVYLHQQMTAMAQQLREWNRYLEKQRLERQQAYRIDLNDAGFNH